MQTTLETILAVKSADKLLSIATTSADMLTMFRDGSFTAYFDNKAADLRIVVDYRAGAGIINVRTLSGYHADKNEWQQHGRDCRIELARRSAKSLVTVYRELATKLKGYFPSVLGLYRRENREWYAG